MTDAHFSPGGAWSLVRTDKQLMILRGESDKPAVALPLAQSENLIMVEWATGLLYERVWVTNLPAMDSFFYREDKTGPHNEIHLPGMPPSKTTVFKRCSQPFL